MSWLNEKLSDWADGGRMLGKSLRCLVQYPSLMLPLLVIWLLSVKFIYFALPRIPCRGMGLWEVIGVVYLLNAGLCLLQLAGCSVPLDRLHCWLRRRSSACRPSWTSPHSTESARPCKSPRSLPWRSISGVTPEVLDRPFSQGI